MSDRFVKWAGATTPETMRWIAESLDGRKTPKPSINGIWPIVDTDAGHTINGYPEIEQMVCVCFSFEDQAYVADLLNKGATP